MQKTFSIRFATFEDIPMIQGMAQVVFRKTYAEILTPEQMEYMIDWMYSEESLKNQIGSIGKAFFVAEEEGNPAGFVSVELEKQEAGKKLFHLQKIYAMPDYQGCGLGRQLFEHVLSYIRSVGGVPFRMELNVNRNNKAVNFYEHMGMFRDREGDFPIGHGFFMNDYIYALEINQ